MKIFRTQKKLKQYLSALDESTIGFVPTMGALHNGHLSLIKKAKQEADIVVCSIFVNPTQFNESADFDNYPITHDKDISILENVACDILYLPEDVSDVYQNENDFTVDLEFLATVMEGENRPGHFDGVMRVVKLLFEITTPTKAFFGLKDFQQYSVIRKMVSVLEMNIDIVGCDIIREDSGLAMSSRNALLSNTEIQDALVLIKTLKYLQDNCKVGAGNILKFLVEGMDLLSEVSVPEYLIIAESETLKPVTSLEKGVKYRAFVVAKIGNVRLIDNIEIFV